MLCQEPGGSDFPGSIWLRHACHTRAGRVSADYGTLTWRGHKDAIQNYMETKLYDRRIGAVIAGPGEPVRGYAYVQGAFKPYSEFSISAFVQVNINAKNRLGGYVGAKPFTFW